MKLTAEMVEDWRTAWANDGLKPEVFAQLNAIADAALRGLAVEWVPVSERLPPDGYGWFAVLISDPDDTGWSTDTWWRADWEAHKWDSCDPLEDGCIVTHWMPLPQPPVEPRSQPEPTKEVR